jgi:hypothetical protein
MSRRPAIPALLCTILLGSAFRLPGPAAGSPQNTNVLGSENQAQGQTTTIANPALDACSLLTSADITAVLGEPLQELKPSAQAAGNMYMSQCLFITRDVTKSASLAVATPASADSGARSLRAFWRSQFHSPRKQEEKRRPASRKSPAKSAFSGSREAREIGSLSESQAEEDARKPRPVLALGEEAFWVGSPVSGALYVLQGKLFLRISVGGIPKESTRIAKCKALASAVLPRLHRLPP